MNRSDIDAFTDSFCQCWDLYGRNMTAGGAAMAFRALSDLEWPTIRAALTAHVQEQPKEPPTPAAVRERINGDPSERAQHAWSKLRRGIRRVGPYRSVAFDDPIIHCAIRDMGGWVAVNDWTSDEVPFRQRDFERAYRAYVRVEGLAHPPYMVGIAEGHNSGQGYEIEPPVLIGDSHAAHGVIEHGRRDQAVTFQRRDERGQIAFQTPGRLLKQSPAGARS